MINKSDLPKFNPDVYTKITLNDLVVFSIHYLHNKNAEVRSENIISACYMLFPKRFSLRNHPHWPDSAMVSRHWGVCRSKGYIAAGTEPGFKLTAKGARLAHKVAKVLGMTISKQAEKVQPSRPKVRAVMPARKVQPAEREEKITKPATVKKVRPPRPKAHVVIPTQKTKTVQKEKVTSPAPAKKTQPPRSKARTITRAQRAQPIQKEKATPPAPTKKVYPVRLKKVSPAKKAKMAEIVQKEKIVLQPAVGKIRSSRLKVRSAIKTPRPVPIRKITPSRPVRKVQPAPSAKVHPPAPIKNLRPLWTEKAKPPEPVVRSVRVEKALPTQPEKTIQPAVAQELKVRAGKYVRAIETSDAYIHYRKNGKSSKISEFDFRSLLLCTMESSPETLSRNVEQFKGYASIHNRKDLVAFLNFCEEKLSYLLAPQIKHTKKPAQRTMK
jgi:hypothetical protein